MHTHTQKKKPKEYKGNQLYLNTNIQMLKKIIDRTIYSSLVCEITRSICGSVYHIFKVLLNVNNIL